MTTVNLSRQITKLFVVIREKYMNLPAVAAAIPREKCIKLAA